MITHTSEWGKRGFCACGWNTRAPHGDLWFVRVSTPVCPRCGESTSKLELETVRYVEERVGTKKVLWLFTAPVTDWFYETKDGRQLSRNVTTGGE